MNLSSQSMAITGYKLTNTKSQNILTQNIVPLIGFHNFEIALLYLYINVTFSFVRFQKTANTYTAHTGGARKLVIACI